MKWSQTTCVLMLLVAICPAQYVTVAYETFDYTPGPLGGLSGGQGWDGAWWSGTLMADALVTAPGFDGTGGKGTTAAADAGSYRKLDANGWGSQVFGSNFGTDGSTIWIRFMCRRALGGDDQYGGLSLNEQFVGEKLFLGCPWMTGEWGFADPGAASITVPGSSCDTMNTLVYRIDYQPGQERLRMWIDPADAYPCTGAALDTMISDHLFNEIRLQSGGGLVTGYDFDGIQIEIKSGELVADEDCLSAAAGGVVTFSTDVGPTYAGMAFAMAGSLSGTSPGTNLGIVVPLNFDFYTDFTIQNWNVAPYGNTQGLLDANGQATSTITVPPGLITTMVGLTAYHAVGVVDFSAGAVTHATNPVPTTIIP